MDHFDRRLELYIKDSFAHGKSIDQVRLNLILHGWREETIDAAISNFKLSSNSQTQNVDLAKTNFLKIFLSLWFKPILFSLFGLIFFGLYAYLYLGDFSLLGLSMTIAGTASLCIGISFALSGLSYYIGYFRRFLGYRRYIGLLGYFFALTYSIMLLFVDPDYYYRGFIANIGSMNFILGLLAMAIFTTMAAISNNYSMKKLGVELSHAILRLGYLAYFILIIRAVIIEGSTWEIWVKTLNGLPPPRILISIFALLVILLRLMLWFSLIKLKTKTKFVNTTKT